MKLNGAAVKAIRERSGLRVEQLAFLCDVSRQMIHMLEHDQRNATDSMIRKLALALHVPMTAILMDEPT